MAIHGPLTAVTCWFGAYDFSNITNEVKFDSTRADLDTTTFGSGGVKTRVGGLYDMAGAVMGLTEYGTGLGQDTIEQALSTNTHVLTESPTGADGAHADFCAVQLHDTQWGGKVGELNVFAANFLGRDANGRIGGTVLFPKQTLTGAATTTGTITQLGAVGSTQAVYAAAHVFSASGTLPTLDITVQSAALVGFGSPTTRLTLDQLTAAGDQFKAGTVGAVSDQFWRVRCVVGGTTPVFSVAVVVGIR